MKETTESEIPSGFNLNAFLISLVLYAAFICLLYFIKISYTPPQESMEMGLDLNYGVDLVGSGNLQTLNEANDKYTDSREMAPPASAKTNDVKVDVVKTVSRPVKQVSENPRVITTSSPESPVSVAPKETKVVSSPSPTSTSEPVSKKPSISGGYNKPGQPNSNGTVGTVAGKGGNNNGDDVGKVGDKGSTKGTPNGKVYYPGTSSGTGGGASVSISGWRNKNLTLPKDNSSQTGEIVFKVTVDDLGQVIAISRIRSTVSPSVENFYKDYITRNLSKSLIADGNPPPRSEGRITIVIKSGN